MAVAYVSSTSFAEGDTGANAVIAKPTSSAIGDVLILETYSEHTAAIVPTSPGDTWVEVHSIDNATPTPDIKFAVHICVLAAAAPANITVGGTNVGWRDCAVHRFTGVDETTPQDVTATENTGSSTTPTGLGLATGTAARHLVLLLADFDGRAHASWTSPLTERNDSGNVSMASGEDTAGTDTANKTATITTSPWCAVMLALRPAGGAAAVIPPGLGPVVGMQTPMMSGLLGW